VLYEIVLSGKREKFRFVETIYIILIDKRRSSWGVTSCGAGTSADLGGSSKYSNVIFED